MAPHVLTSSDTIIGASHTARRSFGGGDLAGLVSRWRFEEGTGTTAVDNVGGNTMSLNGGVTWPAGQVESSAAGFDGVNDYGSIAHDSSLALSGAFTVALWARHAALLDYTGLFCKGDQSDTQPNVAYQIISGAAGDLQCLLYDEANNARISACAVGTLTTATWQHMAVTFDGSTTTAGMSFYVGGTLQTASGFFNDPSFVQVRDTTQITEVGSFLDGGTRLFGAAVDIDQLEVYNRVLSASEIATLAAA